MHASEPCDASDQLRYQLRPSVSVPSPPLTMESPPHHSNNVLASPLSVPKSSNPPSPLAFFYNSTNECLRYIFNKPFAPMEYECHHTFQ